jgi:uncharacterized protein (TIGR04255 family)
MKYPRAPITEALMDIRVQPRDGLNVGELRELSKGANGEEFGTVNDQYRIDAAILPGSTATQTTTPTKIGFQFRNASADKIIQGQLDGWSFSKLAPYDCWEKFQRQGRELWGVYRGIAQPKRITRVAVRYINRCCPNLFP